jgi:hypothetical protein
VPVAVGVEVDEASDALGGSNWGILERCYGVEDERCGGVLGARVEDLWSGVTGSKTSDAAAFWGLELRGLSTGVTAKCGNGVREGSRFWSISRI